MFGYLYIALAFLLLGATVHVLIKPVHVRTVRAVQWVRAKLGRPSVSDDEIASGIEGPIPAISIAISLYLAAALFFIIFLADYFQLNP